jgi:two-component system cell cycle response regulator CpdR
MAHATQPRILLVDDNELIREMAADILQDERYQVAQAGDAQEALAQLQQSGRFDLLLSDIRLPGMSGRELADVARRLDPDLPIVFMTGYAEEALKRDDFLGRGMALLRKPFSLAELRRQVREALAAPRD